MKQMSTEHKFAHECEPGKYLCHSCACVKDVKEFSINPSAKRGHDITCKACRNEKRRGTRQEEGHKTRMKKYGLTPEDYENMLKEQHYSCAICHTHISKLKVRLHVDHCHTTGKVRGLLCVKCNQGIGMFNDDAELLDRAMDYLEQDKMI